MSLITSNLTPVLRLVVFFFLLFICVLLMAYKSSLSSLDQRLTLQPGVSRCAIARACRFSLVVKFIWQRFRKINVLNPSSSEPQNLDGHRLQSVRG